MNMSTPQLLHKHIYTPSVCPDSTVLTWFFSWWPIKLMKVSSLKHCMIFRVRLYYVNIPLSVSLTYFRRTVLPVTFCFLSIHGFRIKLCVVVTYLNSKHLRNFWQCWTGFSQLCKISIFTESTFFFLIPVSVSVTMAGLCMPVTVASKQWNWKSYFLENVLTQLCSDFVFGLCTVIYYINITFSKQTAGMLTETVPGRNGNNCMFTGCCWVFFFFFSVYVSVCFRYCLIF